MMRGNLKFINNKKYGNDKEEKGMIIFYVANNINRRGKSLTCPLSVLLRI